MVAQRSVVIVRTRAAVAPGAPADLAAAVDIQRAAVDIQRAATVRLLAASC